MNAYKVETVLAEDGTVLLKGLPFHAGDAVEIIILERSQELSLSQLPESGFSFQAKQRDQQEQSLEAVTDLDYLTAVAETMVEWNSEADNLAYANL